MRVVTQQERHNRNEIAKGLIKAQARRDRVVPAVKEAAVMAGEMIAHLNSDHKVTADEVIKAYRPDYLKKRGEV